jgi:hypothetical protein
MQAKQRTIKLVNVHKNDKNELCATLTDDYIAVECEDVLYLDFVDQQAMRDTYHEWRQLALCSVEGYKIL